MRYVSTTCNGHQLVAATAGVGPTVVLIPGHTMSIDRWVDAGYVASLSQNRQVVVVDPLGHGRSAKTADIDAYSPDQLIAHLLAVFDHLKIEKADVWGYSRGAGIGGLLARRHSDRVRSLIYGGNVLFDPQPILDQLGLLPSSAELEDAHRRALAGDWSAYWQHFPAPLPDAVKADIETRNDLPSISASSLAGHRDPIVWAVPEDVPTFAYWGSDEIFHQMNVDAANQQDIMTAVIGGGHAQAFDPCGPAVTAVEAFLHSLA